ncbi:MAG: NifB/NifX family molybdenum-iron cluster-binding protein [Limnochordia bacterium]|jgi:predicted Fe-Mo cluster-binding NifX family protein
MTKIAVACEKDMVTEHFGHCANFSLFEVENNQIVNSQFIPNPGHQPGFLPNFLHDLEVKVIISGGMGTRAMEIFNEKGIEVVVGATGNHQAAVEGYLNGSLKSSGILCQQHLHRGQCGE